MIPRFCKLTFDVFSISIRKYSPRGRPAISSFQNEAKESTEIHEDEEEKIDWEPNLEEMDKEFREEKIKEIENIKSGDLLFGGDPKEMKKKMKVPVIECMKKKLNFYKGDTWAKSQPLPLASRSWQNRLAHGDYFTIYPYGDLTNEDLQRDLSFHDLNLDEQLLKNLEADGNFHPATIQQMGIPPILAGENVAMTADTGSGKTLAYLVPLIQKILEWKRMGVDNGINKPFAVIVTPSRELAFQIGKLAKILTKEMNLGVVTLRGGNTKSMVTHPPVNEVDLLVGTIGIVNKLAALGIYKFSMVRMVVADEADTLFDESFAYLLRKFLKKIQFSKEPENPRQFPEAAQLILTSATLPEDLPGTLHNVIETASIRQVNTKNHHFIRCPQKFLRLLPSLKPMTLLKYVKKKNKCAPTIIFSNKNETCDFISIFLRRFNVESVNLNGNMPVKYRNKQFSAFQNGHYNVLSATDAGCKGLDTKFARDVINYDFPLITSEYVHRCGRVGRIGSPENCRIINFISAPLEIILAKKIEFAARKLNPIPMLDFVHLDEDVEDEFKGDDLEKFRHFIRKKSQNIRDADTNPEDLYTDDTEVEGDIDQPRFLPT